MTSSKKENAAALHGGQIAGRVGTAVLVAALVIRWILSPTPLRLLDSASQALGTASIGLASMWIATFRNRALPPNASAWWTLGLAAGLAGWAEIAPASEPDLDLSALAFKISLMIAGGLMMPICSQAIVSVQSNQDPPPSLFSRGGELELFIATGAISLALLILSVQTFFALGSVWPETTSFKALAGVWLVLLSMYLLRQKPASSWLALLSALLLAVTSLS
jgi:hypothetical protein